MGFIAEQIFECGSDCERGRRICVEFMFGIVCCVGIDCESGKVLSIAIGFCFVDCTHQSKEFYAIWMSEGTQFCRLESSGKLQKVYRIEWNQDTVCRVYE